MSHELKHILKMLILPFWLKNAKYSWWFLSVLGFFTLLVVGILIKINYWQAEFYSALEHKNMDRFLEQLVIYAILLGLLVVASIGALYSERRLYVHWREWLSTYFIRHWIHHNNFYYTTFDTPYLDNPDQRLTQDIDLFCKNSIEFFLRFSKEGLKLFSFITILWALSGPLEFANIYIPGWLVWVSLIYATVGTMITLKIGKPLIELDKHQERYEANFRYSLVQMRDHAALITENQTVFWEEQHFYTKLKKVVVNYRHLIVQKLWLDLWGESFKYSTYLLPFVLTCPLYFAGKIDFGQLMQLKAAYASVQYSLSLIIHQYHRIAEWKANAGRLLQFYMLLQNQRSPVTVIKSSELIIKNMVLYHNQWTVAHPVNFQLPLASKTVIFGPNGCGKSLFFKGIFGLWPETKGEIHHPAPLLRLSQEPYISNYLWQDFTNAEIMWCKKLLQRLSPLPSAVHSFSEKQRFCLAQLLTKAQRYAHCWVILDEPLGFLDFSTQKLILEMFTEYLNHCTVLCLTTNPAIYDSDFFKTTIALKEIFWLTPSEENTINP